MTKKELRKQMTVLRDSLNRQEIDKKSNDIFNNLIDANVFEGITEIYVFVNYKSECDTSLIINHCLKNNIKVAVPKVNKDEMDFFIINDMSELKKGTYGILEPVSTEKSYPNDTSLIIMPGLVFDYDGNRIGYGGGYYDKYLSINNAGKHIAVCYDFQIIDNDIIEVEVNDILPDMIISDKQIIKVHLGK